MHPNLYFAYGSNLCAARLVERAPSARLRGAAQARGFALRLDKRGADGSAKANLHVEAQSAVWGAAYELAPEDWRRLDAHEPGYQRIELAIWLGDVCTRAQTYRSDLLIAEAPAAAWYKQLIVDGARAHALPADWCAWLDSLPAR